MKKGLSPLFAEEAFSVFPDARTVTVRLPGIAVSGPGQSR